MLAALALVGCDGAAIVSRAREVTPAGPTLTTPEGVTLTFPPDAVSAPVNVSATWLDADRVRALDAPTVIDEGDTTYTLRGALVVSDLVVDVPVRVRIPLPPDLLASEVALRSLDDARGIERLDPVASGEGSVEFEVPHFSAWGLVQLDRTDTLSTPECGAVKIASLRWSGGSYASGVTSMSLLRGEEVIPVRTSDYSLGVQCNDRVRATERMNADFLVSAAGNSVFTGSRYTLRLLAEQRSEVRFAVPEAVPPADFAQLGALLVANSGSVRLGLFTQVAVVVSNGAADVRGILCQSGYGVAVASLAVRGRSGAVRVAVVGVNDALAQGSERYYCINGSVPVGRAARVRGACLVPADCAAPAVCDGDEQRCVLPRGATCTGTQPCAYGSECSMGRCVASMVAPGAPLPCSRDADCPGARCDLRVRAC